MAANRPVRAKECLEFQRERVAPNVERDALNRHVEEDLAVDDATRVAARVFHRSLFSRTRAEALAARPSQRIEVQRMRVNGEAARPVINLTFRLSAVVRLWSATPASLLLASLH